MDAVTQVPTPVNEPVHGYAPGSPERARLEAKLKELAENPIDLPMTIGGEKRMGGGDRFDVVQPHNHKARIGTYANATQADARDASRRRARMFNRKSRTSWELSRKRPIWLNSALEDFIDLIAVRRTRTIQQEQLVELNNNHQQQQQQNINI